MSRNYSREIRSFVGKRRVFIPGVRAVIVSKEGGILLQCRKDNNLWGLPGGAVELDETVFEALRREVAEETSLEVIDAQPMGIYCGPDQRFTYPNGDQVQCFAIAFIVHEWRGTPHADGNEGDKVYFFPPSKLPENVVPVHKQTLEDYLRYNGSFMFQ